MGKDGKILLGAVLRACGVVSAAWSRRQVGSGSACETSNCRSCSCHGISFLPQYCPCQVMPHSFPVHALPKPRHATRAGRPHRACHPQSLCLPSQQHEPKSSHSPWRFPFRMSSLVGLPQARAGFNLKSLLVTLPLILTLMDAVTPTKQSQRHGGR